MAVGFDQTEERTYTFTVKASTSDYIWSDERIEEAKASLDSAFYKFEKAVEGLAETIDRINTVRVEYVRHGESKTI